MIMRTGVALLLAGLLGACATTDNRYRDGSYYSPAGDGQGDYYYARERRNDFYYGQGPFGFYPGPIGLAGFDGYCSARFFGCVPWWYGYGDYYDIGNRYGFVFLFYGGGGAYPYYPYWSPYPYRRHDHRQDSHHDGHDTGATPVDPTGVSQGPVRGLPPRPEGGRRFDPRPDPDPTMDVAGGEAAATLAPDVEAPVETGPVRHRAPAPAMPAPAGSSVRIRYPVVDPPQRRDEPARPDRPARSDRPLPPPRDPPATERSSWPSSDGNSGSAPAPSRRTRRGQDGGN